MRRMRSGVGRSRSTVKPDGTSDNSELGSRTGHGKENVSCRYGHPSRIIHRAAPKVRKNRKMDPAYIEQRVKRGAPVRPALWPALEKLQYPTLVIWGTESDVLSESQARRMAQTLPNGELVSVPGVGHAPILTEPAALSAIERVLGQ